MPAPSHQKSRTSIYNIWQCMRQRCTNPNRPRYSDWGGRGITVCERWSLFENFLADVGIRPSPDHTLDRIENDKGCCKENCRWATRQEQNKNQRQRKDACIFREHFDPSTGVWVHNHPQLAKLRQLYQRLYVDSNGVKRYTTKIEKPTETRTMKFDDVIEMYVSVRDRKSELTAKYKADAAKFDAVLEKIEAMILQQFEKMGTDSVKTAHGTAYKSTRTSAQVADWDVALEFIKENQLWHLLERRVAKAGVEEYQRETGEYPPGLNMRSEVVVNVRRT